MKKITSENYVENVLNTESSDLDKIRARMTDTNLRLLHAVLGLTTEAAELTDALKKHLFYGKELDVINLKEELGDSTWYVGIAIDVLQTTFDEILTLNIEKLRKRYPEKFTEKSALNRDTKNELNHIDEK